MLSTLCPSSSTLVPISSHFITRFPSPQHNPTARLPTGSCSNQARFILKNRKWVPVLLTAGVAVALVGVGPAVASESPPLLLLFHEPPNALSLPTWAIHVSSVVEWVIAMALVWQYGEKPGNESWKGLSWGMVPLLGGAFCACTWHFFYNAESLEVLVALQAALTVLGNATMCIAAFRIYQSKNRSKNV